MNTITNLLSILLIVVPWSSNSQVIDIAYYELPPFIYKGTDNTLKGLIPNITQALSKKCNITFNYSLDTKTASNFSNVMKNKGKTKNSTHNLIWLPLNHRVSEVVIRTLDLNISHVLFLGVDVLVHRDQGGIYAKVKVGIYTCRYLFLVGLMLLMIYGVTIWFIERWKNTAFSSHFSGIFNGMWLGLVTMTTVGYGDFTPGSVFGKLITMV